MTRVLIMSSLMAVGVGVLVPGVSAAQVQTQQATPAQQQPVQQQQSIEIVDHGSVEQQQVAPAPETRRRPRLGLIIGGAVMFGVSYVAHAAIVSPLAGIDIVDGVETNDWSDFRVYGAIPLAGPWLQLGAKPTDPFDDGWGAYLIANGILQAAGVTMLILGFVLRRPTDRYAQNDSPSIVIAPMAQADTMGLTAFGSF